MAQQPAGECWKRAPLCCSDAACPAPELPLAQSLAGLEGPPAAQPTHSTCAAQSCLADSSPCHDCIRLRQNVGRLAWHLHEGLQVVPDMHVQA